MVLGWAFGTDVAAARTDGSVPAPAQITQLVTHVPASTLNRVGAGVLQSPAVGMSVIRLHRHLRRLGKPELITANLAWCPHCAANSWGLAVALSRFGTLTGLREINSGTYYCRLSSDPCALKPVSCFPYTHGLSFLDARYQSSYLSFAHIVWQTVTGRNLQNGSRGEMAALNQFDRQGQAPAVDVGGAFGFLNSAFSPGDLAHRSWSQIAGSLSDPRNRIAQRVDGLANLFSAAICQVTAGRPKAVCTSRGVIAARDRHLH